MTVAADRRATEVWETGTVDPAGAIRRGAGDPPVPNGRPSPLP
jgi:hypothetical protein